jgi:hypothetical protein
VRATDARIGQGDRTEAVALFVAANGAAVQQQQRCDLSEGIPEGRTRPEGPAKARAARSAVSSWPFAPEGGANVPLQRRTHDSLVYHIYSDISQVSPRGSMMTHGPDQQQSRPVSPKPTIPSLSLGLAGMPPPKFGVSSQGGGGGSAPEASAPAPPAPAESSTSSAVPQLKLALPVRVFF